MFTIWFLWQESQVGLQRTAFMVFLLFIFIFLFFAFMVFHASFSIHCPLTFLLGYKFSTVFTLTLNSIFHPYCNKPRILGIHLTCLSQHLSGVFVCFSGPGSAIPTVFSQQGLISHFPLCCGTWVCRSRPQWRVVSIQTLSHCVPCWANIQQYLEHFPVQ